MRQHAVAHPLFRRGLAALGGAVMLAVAAVFAGAMPAAAAVMPSMNVAPTPGEKMIVDANQIVYDYDHDTVAAVGNVHIYYGGYTLQSGSVTYIQKTGRLIASGGVKMVDRDGNAYFADKIDITDSFRDGFVESLRVVTPDRTFFTAQRAERANGDTTTFITSTYTACEPCKEHPEKPPTWQIKAAKIIFKQQEKTVAFEQASLEFFGHPIAYLPYFSIPDPSVKRKSGFLFPEIAYTNRLGVSLSVPYFWALAPNYDITFTPTLLSNQGLLSAVEWRHRLANGQYSVQLAGIYQLDKGAFLDPKTGEGTFAQHDFRGGIRTTGEFDLNQYWSFGWDLTATTDRRFTHDYDVLNDDKSVTTSTIHLTGLRDRNYFEARIYHFTILDDKPGDPLKPDYDPVNAYDQNRQAFVAPSVDYERTLDDPVMGGEVTWTTNFTALTRKEDDPFKVVGDPTLYYHGTAGTYVRATAEADWQKRFVGPGGQVFTPFASLRGDFYSMDPNGSTATQLTSDPTATRFMPAVGFEWSWPILARLGYSSHIIEPIAQLIIRPNETGAGELPNNDAQSLVFDDTTLFSRDKFSGFDRIEGGTRLNVGIHYLGTFASGFSVDALFGQSYQLAGDNPYAAADIAYAAATSGLATATSDYVGRVAVTSPEGATFTARGRFDQHDFGLNRGEIIASKTSGSLTAAVSYLYLAKDPNAVNASGEVFDAPASVIRAAGSVAVNDEWKIFGGVAYDFTNASLAANSLGIAYDNSCLSVSVAYSETRDPYTDLSKSQSVKLRLALRTLTKSDTKIDYTDLN